MRAVLLLVSLFGVVVLAVVAWQLLTLEWTPQGINQRPRDSRYWRSEQAPRHGRQSGQLSRPRSVHKHGPYEKGPRPVL